MAALYQSQEEVRTLHARLLKTAYSINSLQKIILGEEDALGEEITRTYRDAVNDMLASIKISGIIDQGGSIELKPTCESIGSLNFHHHSYLGMIKNLIIAYLFSLAPDASNRRDVESFIDLFEIPPAKTA